MRHGVFVLIYRRVERDGPLVNVVAHRVQAFGPEVLPSGTHGDEGASRLDMLATTPAGRGPTTRPSAPHPADALSYRSHDFR